MKIYYEHHKSIKENASTLVCVAGSAEGIYRFEPYLEMLTQNFNVVVFDNPGVGKTELNPAVFTAEDLAVEYQNILDELNIQNYNLLGHSFGGFISQSMALNAPEKVKKLILISIGIGSFVNQEKILKYQFDFDRFGYKSLFGKDFFSDGTQIFDKFLDVEIKRDVPAEVYFAYKLASSKYTSLTTVSQIKAETLIVHGAEDQIVDIENGYQLAKLIPNARLLELENVGHYPYIEKMGKEGAWSKIIDFIWNKATIGSVVKKDFELIDNLIKQDEQFKQAVNAENYDRVIRDLFNAVATKELAPQEAHIKYIESINGK
ncbi:MAG: alpha/beta hydrolase [Proteobacteria bacterium]|nr:alpha/beta hydrolase [Pseudomonadota bacterium]